MPSPRGLALILIALAPAARAEGPAVSALNGKFSLESGSVSAQHHSSAIGIAQGSVTSPLGHSFGVQLDGQATTAYSAFLAAAGLHVFWRDPAVGLFGPIAPSLAEADDRGRASARKANSMPVRSRSARAPAIANRPSTVGRPRTAATTAGGSPSIPFPT